MIVECVEAGSSAQQFSQSFWIEWSYRSAETMNVNSSATINISIDSHRPCPVFIVSANSCVVADLLISNAFKWLIAWMEPEPGSWFEVNGFQSESQVPGTKS
jgi:hypothetical protein